MYAIKKSGWTSDCRTCTAPRKKSLLCSGNGMWLWESWAAIHSRQHVSTDVCKTNAFRCSSRMVTTGDSSEGRGQVEVLAQWPVPLRLVCPLIGWCQEWKQAREMALRWPSVCRTITGAWVQFSASPGRRGGVGNLDATVPVLQKTRLEDPRITPWPASSVTVRFYERPWLKYSGGKQLRKIPEVTSVLHMQVPTPIQRIKTTQPLL